MGWSSRLVPIVAALTASCAISAASYFYSKRKTVIDEVLVFCKLKFNIFSCFDRAFSYVTSAKKSVDICMPGIHNQLIIGRLLEIIKKKAAKARIIIDQSGYNLATATFIDELKEAGAEIKWSESEVSMQHKFCLIDREILMTGTLNWGDDLSADDWNYVLITSKPHLVEPVKEKFDKLWSTCDRIL